MARAPASKLLRGLRGMQKLATVEEPNPLTQQLIHIPSIAGETKPLRPDPAVLHSPLDVPAAHEVMS